MWLTRVTDELNSIEFPDKGLAKFARQVVTAADARKRHLAERYRQELHFAPDLRNSYDRFDPGSDRW